MLEVSVEQTILSEFILWSASGGVTPSTIPNMTDEFLAKVHQTPLVSCEPSLRSVIRPHNMNLLGSPLAWIARDTTPTSCLKCNHTWKLILNLCEWSPRVRNLLV